MCENPSKLSTVTLIIAPIGTHQTVDSLMSVVWENGVIMGFEKLDTRLLRFKFSCELIRDRLSRLIHIVVILPAACLS